MITALNTLPAVGAHWVAAFDPAPVDPGFGGDLSRLFGWLLWICIVICLAFLVIGITKIAASMRDGGELSGVKQAGLSVLALVLLGSFGTLTSLLAVNL